MTAPEHGQRRARRLRSGVAHQAPVEYAVAVERYLSEMRLEEASRRVYRIALATWTWPLLGLTSPGGTKRRGTVPPTVPLSLLDGPAAAPRLRAAIGQRAATTDPRTLNRELSILRGAVTWWRVQGWINGDPTKELPALPLPASCPPVLTREDVAAIFRLPASLREQTCWHLLYETGARVEQVLALNIEDLDLARQCLRAGRPGDRPRRPERRWRRGSARLLPLLLIGRVSGPVFLAGRRAPPATAAGERCPLTGRGRLSYRRAAELFTRATKPIDPAGRGWTLRQLRAAGLRHGRS